jgi:integrase/recombinase XerD
VFLGATAPHAPLGRSGVSSVITRLGRHAGITPRVGAHRLRHGAASAVLSGGGTLVEVAQLLRHTSVTTTVIYAKVDTGALRTLARPWPVELTAGLSELSAEPS